MVLGVNDHGICYFTNQYEIIPGVITTLFHVYCIGFIAYIFRHYIAHGRLVSEKHSRASR